MLTTPIIAAPVRLSLSRTKVKRLVSLELINLAQRREILTDFP